MKITRDLDDRYYQLLEKLSGLRATINNLQGLSVLTGQLHIQFRQGTDELETDLHKQIGGFGGFGAQRAKIEAMEIRVKEGKKKADGLSERLDAARGRVTRLEESEKEYQDSISCECSRHLASIRSLITRIGRLRWMWIVLGTICGLIIAAFVFETYRHAARARAVTAHHGDAHKMQQSARNFTHIPLPAKTVFDEAMGIASSTTEKLRIPDSQSESTSSAEAVSSTTCSADEDSFLRIFDEL